MRAVWGGFALGVWWLQQQSALPAWGGWFALVVAAVAAGAWAVWALVAHEGDARDFSGMRCRVRGVRHAGRCKRASGWLALWLAAACVGFGYASWRAQLRLADALPPAWQTRDVDVTGYIAGMPSLAEGRARFLFAVQTWAESREAAHLPRTIQLTWVAGDTPLPPLVPGARWRLPVRLKRPHGERNFGLRDAEAALLARGVRATGYVGDPRRALRLPGDERGIGILVERWRAATRARIEAVLADAPHRGIVVALATGAQDAVSNADWQLMRNTGTSHLVAISW